MSEQWAKEECKEERQSDNRVQRCTATQAATSIVCFYSFLFPTVQIENVFWTSFPSSLVACGIVPCGPWRTSRKALPSLSKIVRANKKKAKLTDVHQPSYWPGNHVGRIWEVRIRFPPIESMQSADVMRFTRSKAVTRLSIKNCG